MAVNIVVVLTQSIGYRAKLTVEYGRFGRPAIPVDPNCVASFDKAVDWVNTKLGSGLSPNEFSWDVSRVAVTDIMPPGLSGLSMFGAFAAALLQESVQKGMARKDAMRCGSYCLLDDLLNACLSNIAISAQPGAKVVGELDRVGGIDRKIEALCRPGIRNPCCVLAWNQRRPLTWLIEQWDSARRRWTPVKANAEPRIHEIWHVPQMQAPLPVIRAWDAMDAILHVFDLQCSGIARRIVPYL